MRKQSDRATRRSGLLYKLDWISSVVGVFRLKLNLVRRMLDRPRQYSGVFQRVNASDLRQEPSWRTRFLRGRKKRNIRHGV